MPTNESIALPFYRRWWFALAAGALVQFLIWCVADVFHVRYGLRDCKPLVIILPVLVLVSNTWLLRPQPSWLLLSVCLAVLSTAVAFVLVLYFGVPFHFVIGGRL
jgi:hypothetical protein